MDMHLESSNREAFELVTDALVFIDRYRESRDMSVLASAKQKLQSARDKDPKYFRAHYFDAIVDDLAGRPNDAVKTFDTLLKEQPPFVEEVRYNLGVAWYHHYSHEALDRAIELFSAVLNKTKDQLLLMLAHAGLAQAHAMHMIPKVADRPDLDQIRRHFSLAAEEVSRVRSMLLDDAAEGWPSKRRIPAASASEAAWTAHNAKGMALMYHSDYLPQPVVGTEWEAQRVRMLQEAVAELDEADRLSPRNWANYCDMASARMRLAFYRRSQPLFTEALSLLTTVVEQLRPDYGFAWYEMGRVLRLRRDFETARGHFERVIKMREEGKFVDVSSRRLTGELTRVTAGDSSFP
jgi:tetratricopeptide (TPR) repeat protein